MCVSILSSVVAFNVDRRLLWDWTSNSCFASTGLPMSPIHSSSCMNYSLDAFNDFQPATATALSICFYASTFHTRLSVAIERCPPSSRSVTSMNTCHRCQGVSIRSNVFPCYDMLDTRALFTLSCIHIYPFFALCCYPQASLPCPPLYLSCFIPSLHYF